MAEQYKYRLEIKPQTKWYEINLREIWQYRDLLFLLVRRDYVAVYKQTVLGPVWFFLQPILQTLFFVFLGSVAGLGTGGIKPLVFYMSGLTFWNYFASCLNATSNTFTANASVFGKVYFPRIIVPLSVVISNLLKMGIQMLLLLAVWIYYFLNNGNYEMNATLLLLPFYIVLLGLMAFGFGIILSSLTTKYRDFTYLVGFAVQLGLYVTPVLFYLGGVKEGFLKTILEINPLTGIIEAARYGLFSKAGEFNASYLGYSCLFTCVILFIGFILFHKVEKNFMDTV